jgi:hypothetical protein
MRPINLFLIIMFSFSAFLHAAKSVIPTLKADPKSNVILVAVMKDTDTPFKNALIDSLRAQFQPKYLVKKVVIKKADELSKQNYLLLIVMDQLKAWLMMNKQTKAIQKSAEAKDVIYFMTAGDAKWQWKTKDVHHIASASEKPRLKVTWNELKIKAEAILK